MLLGFALALPDFVRIPYLTSSQNKRILRGDFVLFSQSAI
jgi:hypothetical protein